MLLIPVIAGSVIVVAILAFAIYFNRLVRLRNRVDSSWHQIDVQLERRHDLVPKLQEVVSAYASHEKETLTNAAGALGAAISATRIPEKAGAEGTLTVAAGSLVFLAEKYPDLKADVEFAKFQHELSLTEGRIAGARKYYNGTVMQYENARQGFPGNIVARLFKRSFPDKEYFEMSENAGE